MFVLPPLQDAGHDLRQAAVEDGHGDDRRVERDKASIMSAEQNGRQRETEQPQRSWIARGVRDGDLWGKSGRSRRCNRAY